MRFRERILIGGGTVLTAATVLVGLANAVLNALLARWLQPAEFGDASVVVSLMLVAMGVAATLQLVTARLVAEAAGRGDLSQAAAVEGRARRTAVVAGSTAAAVLVLAAPGLAALLNLADAWPLVVFAIGIPFYFAQAASRGALQGHLRFGHLALTLVFEAGFRVMATVAMVRMGAATTGVAAGLTASFVGTWAFARRLAPSEAMQVAVVPSRRDVASATGLTVGLLGAQTVINHADMLMVKAAGTAVDAGAYAVVALLGRAVYFCTWSVAAALFPAAARRDDPSSARTLWRGVPETASADSNSSVPRSPEISSAHDRSTASALTSRCSTSRSCAATASTRCPSRGGTLRARRCLLSRTRSASSVT